MNSHILSALLLAALVFLFGASAEKPKLTVILSADDGSFSNLHEQFYIIKKVLDQDNITSEISPLCQSAFMGTLVLDKRNFTVLMATTGIGATASSICSQAVFNYAIKGQNKYNKTYDVEYSFFTGTSGFTPFQGGFMPPKLMDTKKKDVGLPVGCEARPEKVMTPNSIGSVCVTNAGFSFHCGMFIENEQFNHPPTGYGECYNYRNVTASEPVSPWQIEHCLGHTGSRSKAVVDSIIKLYPDNEIKNVKTPKLIVKNIKKFFESNQYGNIDTTVNPWSLPPKIFSGCLETSDHDIWTGAQGDYLCRTKVAQYRKVMNDSSVDPKSVFCVTAMEGFAYSKVASSFGVPGVIVRGMSNYDMYPLQLIDDPSKRNSGKIWIQNTSYINHDEHINFVKKSYRLAILTTNTVILNFMNSQ